MTEERFARMLLRGLMDHGIAITDGATGGKVGRARKAVLTAREIRLLTFREVLQNPDGKVAEWLRA